jgi:hypothetical protein
VEAPGRAVMAWLIPRQRAPLNLCFVDGVAKIEGKASGSCIKAPFLASNRVITGPLVARQELIFYRMLRVTFQGLPEIYTVTHHIRVAQAGVQCCEFLATTWQFRYHVLGHVIAVHSIPNVFIF